MRERKQRETEPVCALVLATARPTGLCPGSPFGIVQQDEHTGSLIVLEALVVVPVGVADQVVEDGRVDDVEQARARVVRGRFLHGVAVALVILPPAAREEQAALQGTTTAQQQQ